MADLYGFNAEEHDTSDNFTPIPNGNYKCILESSEMKETKAGDGEYLKCKFLVVEGDKDGRKLFHNINLKNPNPIASEIGKKDLAKICKAVNVKTPKDSSELHNIPMILKVVVVKDDYKGEGQMKNEIKHFSPVGEASQTASPAVSGESKKPWEK